MKYTRFKDIPQYSRARYATDVPLTHIPDWISRNNRELELDMDPDFQRAHVWTEDKQIHYLKHILRGGTSARDIYWNHPGWMGNWKGTMVLVDGKQRLEAIRLFLNNEVKVYGSHFCDYEDPRGLTLLGVKMHVNDLQTRVEVLQWYLDMNDGGVVHTSEEIEKVRALLEEEK